MEAVEHEGVKDASHLYEVERRARHAERPGFRVSELQIGPRQQVPWHYHSNIQDTFYVLQGRLRLFLRDPKEEVRLGPGETYTVRERRPHLVTNGGEGSAVFLVLQGIGEYDYVPLTQTLLHVDSSAPIAKPTSPVEVVIADAATAELVEAFGRLLPQLSSSAARPTRESLAEIIGAPHNTVLLARDPSAGNRIIGTLTLVIFRIPSAMRAWIEDVVVDDVARGRGVGEALTLAAVDLAKRRGAKTVDLTSHRSRQPAHRLYEKAGFHVRDTSVYRFGPKPDA